MLQHNLIRSIRGPVGSIDSRRGTQPSCDVRYNIGARGYSLTWAIDETRSEPGIDLFTSVARGRPDGARLPCCPRLREGDMLQDPKSSNWIKVTHTADGAMSVTHTYSEAAVSGSEFPGKPLIF